MKQRQFNKYFNKEKKGEFYVNKTPKYKNKINVIFSDNYLMSTIVKITFKYKKLQRSFKVKDFWTNPVVIE